MCAAIRPEQGQKLRGLELRTVCSLLWACRLRAGSKVDTTLHICCLSGGKINVLNRQPDNCALGKHQDRAALYSIISNLSALTVAKYQNRGSLIWATVMPPSYQPQVGPCAFWQRA